jgi:hypothetical protein
MTGAEALEAGLLVEALAALPELTAEVRAETYGPFEDEAVPWKQLCLEVWARQHEDDNGQERIGPTLALPPTMMAKLLSVVASMIAARLTELGVTP